MSLRFPSHPNHELMRKLRKSDHSMQKWSLLYRLGVLTCEASLTLFGIKMRAYGRHHEPTSGGVVFVSNHQSYLDPPMVGVATQRPMNFMARDSLFRVPLLGPILHRVNAFPVKRGTADTGAIREAMRRIKRGGMMTIFPEGTRSFDGIIKPFRPGVSMLAQRAADWVVPVCVDGAYEIWPRQQILPSGGEVTVEFGEPIDAKTIRKQPPEEFLADVRQRVIELQHSIRTREGKPLHRYDD
ncbi:MAG: 1-acyl-sn-glycerol-3-phosphate acyltransferase [Phycisphaerales bacterium]|jgi:1-acyl-sn-glycerol-3-phosphate acyltransferase|nr:1-acyl-sn-glycerol-3-phosphate acyltransferase [Phycisphaerales bacterium]MBT7170228.1 1-acyl-sn-glycerol-3-phosphate acyltransferase [Phycisphaerales bacterium]